MRPPFPLAALQASCTTEVVLKDTRVADSDLLAGPSSDILSNPGAVGTAGLETSALALGQARARTAQDAGGGVGVHLTMQLLPAAFSDAQNACASALEAKPPTEVR